MISKDIANLYKKIGKHSIEVPLYILYYLHRNLLYWLYTKVYALYTNKLYSNPLVCVSPYYLSGNFRINSFFKYFQRPLALEKHELLSDKNQLGYTYNIGIIKLLPNAQHVGHH